MISTSKEASATNGDAHDMPTKPESKYTHNAIKNLNSTSQSPSCCVQQLLQLRTPLELWKTKNPSSTSWNLSCCAQQLLQLRSLLEHQQQHSQRLLRWRFLHSSRRGRDCRGHGHGPHSWKLHLCRLCRLCCLCLLCHGLVQRQRRLGAPQHQHFYKARGLSSRCLAWVHLECIDAQESRTPDQQGAEVLAKLARKRRHATTGNHDPSPHKSTSSSNSKHPAQPQQPGSGDQVF